MQEVGKWAVEYMKTGFEMLVRPPMETFMEGHPVVVGVVAGGLVLLAIVAIASRKKRV